MLSLHKQIIDHRIKAEKTIFTAADGEKEIHILLSADNNSETDFPSLLAAMLSVCERQAAQENAAIILQRFFVTDAANRQAIILNALKNKPLRAVSIVEQPPANGSEIALWAYLSTGASVSKTNEGMIVAKHRQYTQFWATNLTANGSDPREETDNIFRRYIDLLATHGLTLRDSCRRTWLFVSDIDRRYSGMIRGRNDAFDREGLTAETHFIASTGIAGSGPAGSSVMMDAVAYKGIAEDKIHYLYAANRMNRTSDYGVRFERGTAIDLPQSRLVFISGTASIDNKGQIVATGDVLRQAERMMGNVEALLAEAGCNIGDIQQSLVYLRNADDYFKVAQWFDDRYPALPRLILHAPVCRTDWLVEIECMASAAKP
ncbi:MAG: hypothetical protein LUI08_03430 [Prevotella sp.]|nr:hypothetical protein [Prevotella sp.]